MIRSKKLIKFRNLSHGFFNKIGGKSDGVYKSLNCGLGSKDKKNNVLKNLKIVKKKIGCKKNNLILLHQIHSKKFHLIKKIPTKKLIGDGLVTQKKNLAISILTADCAPILIYDSKTKMIGAVHAGWKGAYKKIMIKILGYFLSKGSKKKNIIVIIGPCIAQENYEIKNDFLRKFINQDKNNKIYFKKIKKKTFFSLKDYLKDQIRSLGVNNIETINMDTYNIKNNFFSSRRSLHNDSDDYGRNITTIMIK